MAARSNTKRHPREQLVTARVGITQAGHRDVRHEPQSLTAACRSLRSQSCPRAMTCTTRVRARVAGATGKAPQEPSASLLLRRRRSSEHVTAAPAAMRRQQPTAAHRRPRAGAALPLPGSAAADTDAGSWERQRARSRSSPSVRPRRRCRSSGPSPVRSPGLRGREREMRSCKRHMHQAISSTPSSSTTGSRGLRVSSERVSVFPATSWCSSRSGR